MAKTTINGTILRPDDTPETGYILFRLAETAALDGIEYSRVPIRVNLDVDGEFTVELHPNDDAGWSVEGNSYLVEERFGGKAPRRFYMVVPTSVPALDYADLATYGNAPTITANIDLAAEFAAFEASANATYASKGELRGWTAPPLRNVVVAAKGADPTPVAVFGGYTWGVVTTTIYRSSDDGETWSSYATAAPSGINNIIPTDDGQVVATTATKLYRSANWATTPTWTEKATANGAAYFLNWGLSGDGTKFITTEYAAGVNFPDSRYVRVSLDQGVTWNVVYDSETEHGDVLADASHLHGCCYDPWSDRFYISEGHGSISGVYYSDDDGATWARAAGMIADPSPTVIVATDDGLVMGTDNAEAGLYGVLRCADPADESFSKIVNWETGTAGTVGFATHGSRDPDTGIVYMGFRAVYTTSAPVILAGTAASGSEVWRHATLPVTAGDDVQTVLIPSSGKLLAVSLISPTTNIIRAKLGRPGSTSPTILDSGRALGGRAYVADSVALGTRSATGATTLRASALGVTAVAAGTQDVTALGYGASTIVGASAAVAVGSSASTTGSQAVAVGHGASAYNLGVAIGYNAAAITAANSVAVGNSATTGGQANAVSLGYLATCTQGSTVSVGALSDATGAQAVALGYNAQATGSQSTALGYGAAASNSEAAAFGTSASATGSQGTAVGKGATAVAAQSVALGNGSSAAVGHTKSVALGYAQITTAANQIRIGDAHLELAEMTEPAAGAANSGRLYLKDNGSGKTQLCVRFNTGAVQVLATEP